jgi:hypothetical protein
MRPTAFVTYAHDSQTHEDDVLAPANRGVQSEAAVLRDLLHGDRSTWLPKLLPVLLPGHGVEEIPYFLQPCTANHYKVEEISAQGIEEVLRVITGRPDRVRPALGALPALPPPADESAGHGRNHGLFHVTEQMTVDSSDQGARVLAANTTRKSSGIPVRRTGQRSAWSALPHGRLGVLLIAAFRREVR